jgi:hypothetical protein
MLVRMILECAESRNFKLRKTAARAISFLKKLLRGKRRAEAEAELARLQARVNSLREEQRGIHE